MNLHDNTANRNLNFRSIIKNKLTLFVLKVYERDHTKLKKNK